LRPRTASIFGQAEQAALHVQAHRDQQQPSSSSQRGHSVDSQSPSST
jgi:hypothetical protein